MALLRPFTQKGEIPVRYFCNERPYTAYIRVSDLGSDWQTVNEIAVRRVYGTCSGFEPDLVIDGGGNIGLFTLFAAATFPSAKILVCEPVPHNLVQIEKHLRRNHVTADVLPVCIGGTQRTIPFYVREANQGSFDSSLPYSSQIDVEVITLASLVRNREANRIFIKLDIEGMEVEALEPFVAGERRPVLVVGEVHSARINVARLRRIFESSGWTVRFEGVGEMTGNFAAWSPAANSSIGESAALAAS